MGKLRTNHDFLENVVHLRTYLLVQVAFLRMLAHMTNLGGVRREWLGFAVIESFYVMGSYAVSDGDE